jgi:hypothetical protein
VCLEIFGSATAEAGGLGGGRCWNFFINRLLFTERKSLFLFQNVIIYFCKNIFNIKFIV